MKVTFPAVLTLLTMLFPLSAKGDTVKITIKGANLVTPIEITAPNIVKNFDVWTGPGVRINGEAVHMDPNKQHGAFIDWPKGVLAERPNGLQRYEVSFDSKRCNKMYVVLYEYDPSTEGGYMYLPGKADQWYKVNVSTIFQGVEGNWFHASSVWEKLVRPLIDKGRGRARK